jgi:hypothetical protein
MSSTFSNLKFELITTGEQSGTWGSTTNTNIGTAIEQAIVGMATLTSANFSSNVATLTLTNTNSAQNARALCLVISAASLSAAGTINVPAIQKPYLIINNDSFAVTVKVSGLTGVSVPAGKRTLVYNNGTDVGNQVDYLASLALGTALPLTSGGTGATSASAARTSLGSTTVGGNLFTLANPSAVTFMQINADNTVTTLDAAAFRTAIGAGSGGGTVTSVTGTAPVAVATGTTTPVISMPVATASANGYLSSADWTTFNNKLTSGGALGTPSSGNLANCTFPTLNQNTSGTAAGLSSILAVASGGTGTATPALVAGTNVTITGTWPNQTINSTASGGGGTVTSVAALTLGTTGTDLSSTVANGTTTPVITLNVPTASASNRGALSAADWTTFNNKQPAGSYLTSGGALGTPSSGTLTNCTFPTLNQNTSGTAAGLSATLAVASGGTGVTSSTGSGSVVLSNSPALVTPALGTPSSGNLANCTFPTLNQNTSGTAAGLSATLAVGSGGTGVTTSTGSGSNVLSNSPTLVTPALGTPSSGNLANCSFPTLNQNTTGSSGSIANSGGWSITPSGTKLYFNYNGTNVGSLDSSGNFIALGNVTAYGTP